MWFQELETRNSHFSHGIGDFADEIALRIDDIGWQSMDEMIISSTT
jgi:hypothetical protein